MDQKKSGVPNGNLFEPLLTLSQHLWPRSTKQSGDVAHQVFRVCSNRLSGGPRPRRDFERLLNPHALGSEDALLEAKEVAEAEA